MNSFLKNPIKSAAVLGFTAAFALAALFVAPREAAMQSGANVIAFDRYDQDAGYSKIFTVNADGSDVVERAAGYHPSWSPDGQKIVYAFGDGEMSEIWMMNADGSNQQQVTQMWGQSYLPVWSPNGQKIAFYCSNEFGEGIYTMDPDGQNIVKLDTSGDPGLRATYAPAWSADGTKIIFMGEKVLASGLGDWDYYAADANNTGVVVRLTNVDWVFDHARAAVSPDGSNIVLEYQHDLYAFKVDGSGQMTNLTPGSTTTLYYPDYAPNGQKIVFTSGTMLNVMNSDGSGRVSLDVVGDNADWNPAAVLPNPTPTPTPTPAVTADVSVQATVAAANVAVGGQISYSVTVANAGTSDATNVQLTATLPANLTAGAISASQGTCVEAAGSVTCSLGTVTAGTSVAVSVTATANALGNAAVTYSAAAAENDPDTANNSSTAVVTISGPCAQPVATPIEVTRSQWRRHDATGQDELILTIRNVSGQSLDPRLVFVFDSLPAGVTVDPSVVAGYTNCAAPLNSPYLVAYAPNKREWKDMQTVSVRILFNNPSRGGIPFEWRLYSGSVNP